VENVADPSHVPFAHHGVQGNRKRAAPIPLKIIKSTASLIEAESQKPFKTTITFEPPCRLEYAISLGGGGKQVGLVTYCLPVSPGKSRIVAQFPRNFAKTLHYITPRWWEHIKTRNLVLDGDMILLHQQEYFLQQRQKKESWKSAYKLPTSADRLAIEFRHWFEQSCHGQLPWNEVGIKVPEKLTINDNRQELLDRYRQHTQHCSSCRRALKWVQHLQVILLGYFALAVVGVTLMPESIRLRLGLPLMAIALLGLAVYSWLKKWLQPRFYFVDYIHAQKK
jgi:phenylpropionate dioxygenase-like ring-hydroxylating dioxygenase large terminal subunit